jgi:hypothetical protein
MYSGACRFRTAGIMEYPRGSPHVPSSACTVHGRLIFVCCPRWYAYLPVRNCERDGEQNLKTA